MRTLAIGDIHGCLDALELLSDYVGFESGDTIVTLGDYVDRGPNSKGVVDFLLNLRTSVNLVPLRGNHEVMMLEARADKSTAIGWLGVGGAATLDSYGADTMDDVPEEHWEFFESTHRYYESEEHFFVHANAHPKLPLASQPEFLLYWEPFRKPKRHQSGKTMVCGHTSQRSGVPLNVGHAVCIDTHVYGDGWLTCFNPWTGQYWQANQSGAYRTDFLSAVLV